MQHAVLYGEYELTIDDKNRMLVPADIRKAIDLERDGDAFFLVIGQNRKPWLYPDRYYQALVTQMEPELLPHEDQLAFDQMNFAMAARLEPDKQGRILVPDRVLRRTGTGKDVTVVGARNHLEVWNRTDWEARYNELLDRSSEVALKAKIAGRPALGQQS